jgi:hypothetical protein
LGYRWHEPPDGQVKNSKPVFTTHDPGAHPDRTDPAFG